MGATGNTSRFLWYGGPPTRRTPCYSSGIARHQKWYSNCPFYRRGWTHMNNHEVIAILDGLIGACKRGQDGFRNAAETIQNSEFRRLFNIFSQQRVQFISELKSEVHRLGGDPAIDAESAAG